MNVVGLGLEFKDCIHPFYGLIISNLSISQNFSLLAIITTPTAKVNNYQSCLKQYQNAQIAEILWCRQFSALRKNIRGENTTEILKISIELKIRG